MSYRGRAISEPGILICEYRKPSLFGRIINWIRLKRQMRRHSLKKPLIVPGSVFVAPAKDTSHEKAEQ